MSLPISHCPVCNTTKNLLRCQGCMVMFYCCRDHQVVDRNKHKRECNEVKRRRKHLEDAERELRAMPPDFMLPANVFEEHAGHFWGIMETRPYMRARYGHVESLLGIKNVVAVQTAFNHIKDMIRLCRSDNMGLRFLVPAQFLRLEKDQECYDFLKWHATTGKRADYDWGDLSLPYLDVRNADVFEPVTEFVGKYAELSYALGVLLIKIRLLRDIKSLHNSAFLSDRLPQELVDRIRKLLVGTIVSQKKDIMNCQDQRPTIKKLESDLEKLFKFVKNKNQYFWPALFDPHDYLTARPEYSSDGSEAQAQIKLQHFYDAFLEIPGAIDMIKILVQKHKLR